MTPFAFNESCLLILFSVMSVRSDVSQQRSGDLKNQLPIASYYKGRASSERIKMCYAILKTILASTRI